MAGVDKLPPTTNSVSNKDTTTYFFEDEIFTTDKRGRVKFGVIISSGTISDEDDDDYVDPGKVRVSLHPDGREVVIPVSQVSGTATGGKTETPSL